MRLLSGLSSHCLCDASHVLCLSLPLRCFVCTLLRISFALLRITLVFLAFPSLFVACQQHAPLCLRTASDFRAFPFLRDSDSCPSLPSRCVVSLSPCCVTLLLLVVAPLSILFLCYTPLIVAVPLRCDTPISFSIAMQIVAFPSRCLLSIRFLCTSFRLLALHSIPFLSVALLYLRTTTLSLPLPRITHLSVLFPCATPLSSSIPLLVRLFIAMTWHWLSMLCLHMSLLCLACQFPSIAVMCRTIPVLAFAVQNDALPSPPTLFRAENLGAFPLHFQAYHSMRFRCTS